MSVVIGGSSSYVNNGLVLYLDAGRTASYPGTGTTWYDLSSSGNNATLYNMTYSNGKMVFNGSNSYGSVGSTNLSTFTSGITVSVMANMNPTSGAYTRFIDFGVGQGNYNIGFCRNTTNNHLQAFYYNSSNAQIDYVPANTLFTDQNTFYTFTLDGTNAKLYVNSTLVNTTPQTALPGVANRTSSYIGRSNWSGDAYYKGTISAVQVYNRALSLAEIQQNYAYVTQGVQFSDGTVLGTASAADNGGLINIKTYSAAGAFTWYKPVGCSTVLVKVVGGGGGATGYCESGGGGGYSEKVVDVTGVNSVAVTVGGGGTTVGYYNAAGDGGTSSFGGYCSASGGYGANRNASHSGGHGGVGSGGGINLYGSTGTGHANSSNHYPGGQGGSSYFGGSGTVNRDTTSTKLYSGSPGAGGPGARTNDGSGGASTGEAGVVVVYAYR